MNELTKIKDISSKYEISTRTLRYYEDMGLKTAGFELDERCGHQTLCHMPNPTDEIKKGLGYHQLDIFVPIKLREG